MPTNETLTFTRPGTHLFSPITEVTLRTSDPAAPETGATLYLIYSTALSKTQFKIIFAGGTPQVIAMST